jgi:hypothetical protein
MKKSKFNKEYHTAGQTPLFQNITSNDVSSCRNKPFAEIEENK